MLPGKLWHLDFYNSPYLYKHTFQVIFLAALAFLEKNFFHLLPVKLGVQMTAIVTPQRLGAGTHPPHCPAAPFSQFLSTELFYSLILFLPFI